jgi:hypothetical protein
MIDYELRMIDYELRIINYELRITNYELRMINYECFGFSTITNFGIFFSRFKNLLNLNM